MSALCAHWPLFIMCYCSDNEAASNTCAAGSLQGPNCPAQGALARRARLLCDLHFVAELIKLYVEHEALIKMLRSKNSTQTRKAEPQLSKSSCVI